MDSGIFGGGFVAFAQGLGILSGDVKALLRSEIYRQRLARCLTHPDNKEALRDFLHLDSIFQDVCDLVSQEAVVALQQVRERSFKIAWTVANYPSEENGVGKRRWLLKEHLLSAPKRTPEELWRQMGWK